MSREKDARKHPSLGDALLWRRVAEGVKPLARRTPRPVPAPVIPPKEPARSAEPRRAPPGAAKPRSVAPPPLRAGAPLGLDRSTHDKLRRGQLPLQGKIDLHGMTRDRAHRALSEFLDRAVEQGRRCILVITGKGGPKGPDGRPGEIGVLKSEVPRWLNEPRHRAQIIAFHAAQPRHGGGGALYVLLKRQRGD